MSIEGKATTPSPRPPDPVQFLSMLLLIFSKMLLSLASCNSAQTSASLRGRHWSQLCPHSWEQVSSCYSVCFLLPGVHFLALLPVSLTVPWPLCSPPWPYMSSVLSPSLALESDGPQTPQERDPFTLFFPHPSSRIQTEVRDWCSHKACAGICL